MVLPQSCKGARVNQQSYHSLVKLARVNQQSYHSLVKLLGSQSLISLTTVL
jgi:hypothetical protein